MDNASFNTFPVKVKKKLMSVISLDRLDFEREGKNQAYQKIFPVTGMGTSVDLLISNLDKTVNCCKLVVSFTKDNELFCVYLNKIARVFVSLFCSHSKSWYLPVYSSPSFYAFNKLRFFNQASCSQDSADC